MGAMSSRISSGLFRYSDHSRRLIISHSIVFSKSKNRRFVRGTIPVSLSTAGGRSGAEQSDLFQKSFAHRVRRNPFQRRITVGGHATSVVYAPPVLARSWDYDAPDVAGYHSRLSLSLLFRTKNRWHLSPSVFCPVLSVVDVFNDAHVINTSVRVYAL